MLTRKGPFSKVVHASVRVLYARTERKSEIEGKILGPYDRTDSRYNAQRKINILIRSIDFVRRNNKHSRSRKTADLHGRKISRRRDSIVFIFDLNELQFESTILRY